MRIIRSSLLALCMLAGIANPAHARVNVDINLSLFPDLVPVPGYPVYYAPRVDMNFFFYDGYYWLFEDDDWYVSDWYNGPWEYVDPDDVPVFVLRIPVRYYRRPPVYFRGWYMDAPPRWGHRWGNDWERQHPGWDRWDRRRAPAPAPLPNYQRNYPGDRYPRGEERDEIRNRHYRYEPRDSNVRERYRDAPQRAREPNNDRSEYQPRRSDNNDRDIPTQRGDRDNRAAPERTREQSNDRSEYPPRRQPDNNDRNYSTPRDNRDASPVPQRGADEGQRNFQQRIPHPSRPQPAVEQPAPREPQRETIAPRSEPAPQQQRGHEQGRGQANDGDRGQTEGRGEGRGRGWDNR